jgi:uncharacterized protein (TIGR03083 family)
MLVYEMIVAERRHMADLFAGLTEEQLTQQSLCGAWTMHEVAAHLATYLRFGQLKILTCMLAYAGNFAPGNQKFARWYARRSTADLIEMLRRNAGSRTTPPRSGYDPVLADLVLHDLDVRIPLGIPRQTPEDRLAVTFYHLATMPSPGYAVGTRLRDLRFEATDTGWTTGSGAVVRGPAQAVVMAMSGRTAAWGDLAGEGTELLRHRISQETVLPMSDRLKKMATTVLRPSDRRSHDVGPPELTDVQLRRLRKGVKSLGGQNLIVTTADGTQYGFGVKLDKWSADLANALKARGCEVRTTPQGLAVTPVLSAGGPRGPYLGL